MRNLAGAVAFAAVALAVAAPASAVTVVATPIFTADGLTTVADFDNPTAAGYTFTVTGALASGIYGPGLTPGIAAPPFGDPGKFYAVLGGDPATNFVTFDNNGAPLALTAFRFDVSSLDTYNGLSFLDKNGNVLASYTGTQLAGFPLTHVANGDQNSDSSSFRLTFSSFSAPVAKVEFSSSSNSFEFDNVGVAVADINQLGGPAPEPMTWVMLLAGFGMLGLALRSGNLGSAFASA